MTSEEAEFSGQEIMRQLEQRRADQRKDWNRNVFGVRTNDDLASLKSCSSTRSKGILKKKTERSNSSDSLIKKKVKFQRRKRRQRHQMIRIIKYGWCIQEVTIKIMIKIIQ